MPRVEVGGNPHPLLAVAEKAAALGVSFRYERDGKNLTHDVVRRVRPVQVHAPRRSSRRTRRVTLRRARARAPGRPDDDPDLADPEAAA